MNGEIYANEQTCAWCGAPFAVGDIVHVLFGAPYHDTCFCNVTLKDVLDAARDEECYGVKTVEADRSSDRFVDEDADRDEAALYYALRTQ